LRAAPAGRSFDPILIGSNVPLYTMQVTTSATEQVSQRQAVTLKRPYVVLLAGIVIGFNLVTLILVQANNANCQKGDFKMFYAAAVALKAGHSADLYNPDYYLNFQSQLLPSLPLTEIRVYTHPPYELLVFWPLAYLPYTVACYGWIAITLLLAIVCARLLSGYAAVLGLFPLLVALLQQQDSVLTLLILTGCWLALSKGRNDWAGFLLGLALFRFQFVLPLALILMFWKPRLLKGFALAAALVAALSFALVGSAGLRSYVNYMSSMAHASSAAVNEHGYTVDPRTFPSLRGLAYEVAGGGGGQSASPAVKRILPAALGLLELLGLVFAWRFMRSDAPGEIKFAFAVLGGLLLSPYLLMHDLVLLAIPFTLLPEGRARWALLPFYVAPFIYWFYPHSQAWLALLLVAGCWLTAFPNPETSTVYDARS